MRFVDSRTELFPSPVYIVLKDQAIGTNRINKDLRNLSYQRSLFNSWDLNMDWSSFGRMRRFHQHFAQGRMSMHVARDLIWREFHHLREGQLGK